MRSKVLLKVLSVVGVTADMVSTRLLAVLDVEPYEVESELVCKDSFGRLVGGIEIGLGIPPYCKDRAAVLTWSRCGSGGTACFIGERSIAESDVGCRAEK